MFITRVYTQEYNLRQIILMKSMENYVILNNYYFRYCIRDSYIGVDVSIMNG